MHARSRLGRSARSGRGRSACAGGAVGGRSRPRGCGRVLRVDVVWRRGRSPACVRPPARGEGACGCSYPSLVGPPAEVRLGALPAPSPCSGGGSGRCFLLSPRSRRPSSAVVVSPPFPPSVNPPARVKAVRRPRPSRLPSLPRRGRRFHGSPPVPPALAEARLPPDLPPRPVGVVSPARSRSIPGLLPEGGSAIPLFPGVAPRCRCVWGPAEAPSRPRTPAVPAGAVSCRGQIGAVCRARGRVRLAGGSDGSRGGLRRVWLSRFRPRRPP